MYNDMNKKLAALLSESDYLITNLSNASALLGEYLSDINWVGFYITEGDRLFLGPFQGKTACVNIPMGRGVCGTAAAKNETQLVKNVHEFPGHIACDACSNSEIVVPITVGGTVVGVLDIDSPSLARFDEDDREGLEKAAEIIGKVWAKCPKAGL